MAKRFFLWMKQRGEGCDYTIGCGEKLEELNGVDEEHLPAAIRQELDDYGEDMEQVLVLSYECDARAALRQMKDEAAAREKEAASETSREAKRAQIRQLQRELDELDELDEED